MRDAKSFMRFAWLALCALPKAVTLVTAVTNALRLQPRKKRPHRRMPLAPRHTPRDVAGAVDLPIALKWHQQTIGDAVSVAEAEQRLLELAREFQVA